METISRIRVFNSTKARTFIVAVSCRLSKADSNGYATLHLDDLPRLTSEEKLWFVKDIGVGESIAAIVELNGVECVYVHPYHIAVRIGLAFEWEDVQDDIVAALSAMLKREHGEQIEVVVENKIKDDEAEKGEGDSE